MIVIYTPKVTNRIKYTLDFVFHHYFGIEYRLTETPEISTSSDNLYINYSNKKIDHHYSVFQDDLLLEEDIKEQKIFVSREAYMPVFFQTTNNYNLKFDIFSCIFYLLSRYEEYLMHEKDMHGRYKSSNSILAKKEFNFSPVVETWLKFFKEELLKIIPSSMRTNLSFKKYEFEYVPTFDVDNPFRFLGRNWKKHPPNLLKTECWKTLSGKQQDKYFIYNKIFNEINNYKLNPIFFFLLNDDGDNNSKVSPDSKEYIDLIQHISSKYDIGLHPSYNSLKRSLLADEYNKLFSIVKRNIYNSRQHFLQISIPELIKNFNDTNALQIDYSLIYPDVIGFRAGISRAFPLFDLKNNQSTTYILQPSCFMDATYKYYQQKKINEIQHDFLTVFNQLKKINGKLVAVFHNDLLSEEIYWGIFSYINQHTGRDEK